MRIFKIYEKRRIDSMIDIVNKSVSLDTDSTTSISQSHNDDITAINSQLFFVPIPVDILPGTGTGIAICGIAICGNSGEVCGP